MLFLSLRVTRHLTLQVTKFLISMRNQQLTPNEVAAHFKLPWGTGHESQVTLKNSIFGQRCIRKWYGVFICTLTSLANLGAVLSPSVYLEILSTACLHVVLWSWHAIRTRSLRPISTVHLAEPWVAYPGCPNQRPWRVLDSCPREFVHF